MDVQRRTGRDHTRHLLRTGKVTVEDGRFSTPHSIRAGRRDPCPEWLTALTKNATWHDSVSGRPIPFRAVEWWTQYCTNYTKKSVFGHHFSPDEVLQLLQDAPDSLSLPVIHPVGSPGDKFLFHPSTEWTYTESGWRYIAGQPWKARKEAWAHTNVVDLVNNGWRGDKLMDTAPFWIKSAPMSPAEDEAFYVDHTSCLRADVVRLVTKDWIKRNGPPGAVCPVFMLSQGDKWRTILDAQAANLGLAPPWFSLHNAWDLMRTVPAGGKMSAMDLTKGYHHFTNHIAHSRYLCYEYKGQLFCYHGGAFGDATAPWAFVKVQRWVKSEIIKNGIAYNQYIDDGFIAHKTDEGVPEQELNRAIAIHLFFGNVLSKSKLQALCITMPHLGVIMDSNKGISAKPEWLEKVEGLPRQTLGEWLAVAGHYAFALQVFPKGLAFLDEFILWMSHFDLTSRSSLARAVEPPSIVTDHLALFHQLLKSYWRSPRPEPSASWVVTDATLNSLAGAVYHSKPPELGGTADTVATFRQMFHTSPHMNHAEAEATNWVVREAVQRRLVKAPTTLIGDNLGVVECLKKGRAKAPTVSRFIAGTIRHLVANDVREIHTAWISSEENKTADEISRDTELLDDWELTDSYWQKFKKWLANQAYPKPNLDAMAASHNKKLQRYLSRHIEPDSLGSFFDYSFLPSDVLWVNPPFALIPVVLAQIIQKKLKAYVLLPNRYHDAWWSLTTRASDVFRLKIDSHNPPFKNRAHERTIRPGFNVAIYYFA